MITLYYQKSQNAGTSCTDPEFYVERDVDDEMSPDNADVLNNDESRPSHNRYSKPRKQPANSGLPTSSKGYD